MPERAGVLPGSLRPTPSSSSAISCGNLGLRKHRRLWEFALGGVKAIRQAILEDQIDCDMQVQDALFVAATGGGAEVISAEYAARNTFGYSSTFYSRESLPSILGSPAYFGALRFGDTFSIDAYRACAGLRQGLLETGARIFERSPVTRILENGVETAGGCSASARPSSSVPTGFCRLSGWPGARSIMCRHSSPSPNASAVQTLTGCSRAVHSWSGTPI